MSLHDVAAAIREVRKDDGYPIELAHPADGAMEACRVCGQRRGKRDPDDAWVLDGPLDPRGPREKPRSEDGPNTIRPLREGQPWRWRHVACEPTAAGVVRSLLGVQVSEQVARAAVAEAGVGVARTQNRADRKPWAFVATDQREALRREVDRARMVDVPRGHVAGRCAWCGRSRSRHWSASGMTWSDGTAAPLCTDCAAVRREVHDPFREDALRRAAMRAFVGLIDSIGETRTHGFRFAAEVIDEEHRHDDEAPAWSYSASGLAAVRAEAYRVEASGIIDPVQRDMQLRILQAKRAKARREQADAAETAEPVIEW